MRSRIVHIDIAKGISIVLVALYHSRINDFFPEVMSAMSLFRMPLFFFLSGIFFSYLLRPKEFFLKKVDALLKPYFFVLLLVFIFSLFFLEGEHLWQLRGMFYGVGETVRWVPMWFLPHLFIVYVFSYGLFYALKFDNLSVYLKWLYVLVLFSIGALNIDLFWELKLSFFNYSVLLPGLPFSIDIVFSTSFYFITGYLLKRSIIDFKPNFYVFLVSLSFYFYISIFTDASINFNNRIYVNPFIASIASICGIYFIIYLSFYMQYMQYIKYIFTALGEASLFILIFHLPINQGIYEKFKESALDSNLVFILASSAFILSLIIPLFIRFFVLNNRLLKLFLTPLNTDKSLQGSK